MICRFYKKEIPLCNLSASEALFLEFLHPSVDQPVIEVNYTYLAMLIILLSFTRHK